MADKDINIHVRAPGAAETKQQLDKTAEGVRGMGASVEGAGKKTSVASAAFSGFLRFFTAAGFIALLANTARKVTEFFDNLHRRVNEAVKDAENMRQAYSGLFEAMGAYSEAERKKVVKDALSVMSETMTPQAAGIPNIERYTRQFKGQMRPDDYQAGLRNVLSYAARHGGAATPELIDMMRGYGMTTAAQQSEFMRTVSAGSVAAGMTDEEIISAMGRAAPSARAIGMSPQETISTISALAAGETGRNKTAMPAMVIEAMSGPNADALKKYGVAGKTPTEISENVRKKMQGLSAEDRYKMLSDIYGAGAVKGVYKMITSGAPAIVPVSEAADRAEREQYNQTLEAQAAQSAAEAEKQKQDITPSEVSQENVSKIGEQYQKNLQRRHPIRQFWREMWRTKEYEKENAAYRLWLENLTPAEKESIDAEVTRRRGFAGKTVLRSLSLRPSVGMSKFYINFTPFLAPAQVFYGNEEQYYDELLTPQQRQQQVIRANQRQTDTDGSVNITHNNNTYITQTPPAARSRVEPNDIGGR
jgi:hypothetical protein